MKFAYAAITVIEISHLDGQLNAHNFTSLKESV
jgi:hypothetical protein